MRTNLEIALTEKPKRGPRNRAEQRTIWRQKLREALDDEKRVLKTLEVFRDSIFMDLEVCQNWPENYLPGSLEHSLKSYSSTISNLFFYMHRVAYFEGLLKTENPEIDDSL